MTKVNNLAPSLQLGISACLLGQRVRYDGDHRYNQQLVSCLTEHFTLIGICPEIAIGLGVPRATIFLQKNQNQLKLLTTNNPDQDHTEAMINYSHRCLRQSTFSGLVLKDRSPSCGVSNTIIRNNQNQQTDLGHGLFTQTISDSLPEMPIISAEQLQQTDAVATFIADVKLFAAKQAQS